MSVAEKQPPDGPDDHLRQREGDCGFCGVAPKCLQVCNNIRVHVLWQSVFTFFEGFLSNGVLNVILVSLERRFSLPSTKSSVIVSANDFGAFVLLLFIGFFGERSHKPRLMGCGILLMVLGSVILVLPHVFGGLYQYRVSGTTANTTTNICAVNESHSESCGLDSSVAHESSLYPLFIVGQIMIGVGAVPMFTIGLTYIDENTDPKMMSLYTGLVYGASAVGVAVGYVVGGATSNFFVDIGRVDLSSVPLNPSSPQWVGAWWTGVLIGALGLLISALPILCYPRRIPGFHKLAKTRKSEAHNDGGDEATARPDFGRNLRDYPRSLLLLLRNPCFVLITAGSTFESLVVGGTASFGAKLLQLWFSVDLSTAGYIMGGMTVPGAGGGMILGGYLVKRFGLKCRGIIRFSACCALLSLVLAPSFLARCSQKTIVGVGTPYEEDFSGQSNYRLSSRCNENCGCNVAGIEPVCAADGRIYFSPCHAGCRRSNGTGSNKIFYDCLCVNQSHPLQGPEIFSPADGGSVMAGACVEDCLLLILFCVLFFLIMVVTFSSFSPTVVGIIRCVPYKQRSMAVGINLLVVRALGTTPGPILMGAIIDSTCQVWQESCGQTGQCWVYNHHDMGLRCLAWFIALKCGSLLSYGLASILYRSPPDSQQTPETETVSVISLPEHSTRL